MNKMSKNLDMSSLAMLSLLLVVVFFSLCAFKVTPLYYKNIMLISTLEGLDSPVGSINNQTNAEIRDPMGKAFTINSIDVNPRDILINRDNNQTSFIYDYEARVELFANIGVVVSFEARYPEAP
jgi:hypothetical protein